MKLQFTYSEYDDNSHLIDINANIEVSEIITLYDCTYNENYDTYLLVNGWYLSPKYNSRYATWEITKDEEYIGICNKPQTKN